MGKFSDPNYKLLKDYFDILVAVRTGTQKSYLLGPNKTVVSEGGIHTILYENNPNRGYVEVLSLRFLLLLVPLILVMKCILEKIPFFIIG